MEPLRIQAQITKSGTSFSDRSTFLVISNMTVNDDILSGIQRRLGFHPGGYGGPMNVKTEIKKSEGKEVYLTTWECSGSCD